MNDAPPVTSASFPLQKLSAALTLNAPPQRFAQTSAARRLYHSHSRRLAPLRPFSATVLRRERFYEPRQQPRKHHQGQPKSRNLDPLRSSPHPTPAEPQPKSVCPLREFRTFCSARSLPPARA